MAKVAASKSRQSNPARNLLFMVFVLGCISASAENPKYPVSAIPADLSANVDAVFRENTSIFTIIARNRASHFVRQVITIYNGKAKFYASQPVFYDKFRKIKSIHASVYDANGYIIKRIKDREIDDRSASGGSMLSDDRYKYLDLSQGVYPYTIEIEYQIDYKFLFIIPEFTVFDYEKISCEKAAFTLRYPQELSPRIKVLNTEKRSHDEKTSDGLLSKTWTFEKVLPLKVEPYGLPFSDLTPTIISAPTDFEYDDYVGRMDTWEGYGKWIASLNKGRDVLPPATIEKMRHLTKDAKTLEEKVKILYEYLQNKTRYVSIQLGIGGYQPFEASVVDANGYGDCKALSNYMVALLDAVSIPSSYTLIRAGNGARALREDFPSTQFNHAIVAVPNEKDTIWLECTSQTNPFGYQGFFTDDRKALLISDTGAKVVRTKSYSAEENTQIRKADVSLESSGNGVAKITTTYSGLQYDAEGIGSIANEPVDAQRQLIHDITRIPTVDLIRYDLKKSVHKNPSAVLKLELGLRRYSTISGKRMFFIPNLMNRSTFIPEKVENRKTDFIEDFPYIDIDTIQYQVPESMYPEFLPEPVKINSQFGEYESSFKLDQGSIVYVRKIKILKGTFSAAAYQEYIEFYKRINRADNTKIILLNKT